MHFFMNKITERLSYVLVPKDAQREMTITAWSIVRVSCNGLPTLIHGPKALGRYYILCVFVDKCV